jgi:hypothetical protein
MQSQSLQERTMPFYLPWRGRCYLPEHASEPLIVARSLAEVELLHCRHAVEQPPIATCSPDRPAQRRGMAALLHD